MPVTRISRNKPCPCGSGKKFKHCCHRNHDERSVPQSSPIPDDGAFLWQTPEPGRIPLQLKSITRVSVDYVIDDQFGSAKVSFCYQLGTRVILADGSVIPVEWLQAGMRFRVEDGGLATITSIDAPKLWDPAPRNPNKSGNSIRRVIGTVKYTGFLPRLDLGIPGDILNTTPDHLFWSEGRQAWVAARTFHLGEFLRNRHGQPVPVISLSPIRIEFCELYNVEVEEFHTYFVGGGPDGGIWTHNGLGMDCRVPRAAVVDENGISVVTARLAGIVKPPDHHIFPQQFRDWFSARGVNVDRYLTQLPRSTHEAIHYRLPGELGGGFWNNQMISRLIARESELGRQLTTREVLQVGAQMRRQFLPGYKLLSLGE